MAAWVTEMSLIDSTWSIRCLQQISCKKSELGFCPGFVVPQQWTMKAFWLGDALEEGLSNQGPADPTA